ncbi:hypothetical protein OG394_28630 [Kribbella sp. NBC_01245]|uniref:hypothetical protein n=1 Tax=Kribbella sp. NBC_01245 TaxID=2903578 RepID=UPI002E2C0173|nr:hypothetical protein [Kribbella sp. NBC_01245]
MQFTKEQTSHALTVLTRLAQRDPTHKPAVAEAVRRGLPASLQPAIRAAVETGQPMADVLAELVPGLDVDGLRIAQALLPPDSVALRFFADALFERLVGVAPTLETEDAAANVGLLTKRAEALLEVGAPQQALPIAQEAVALALEDPTLTHEVAQRVPEALRVLSRCQAQNGDHDAAVATARDLLHAELFTHLQTPCVQVARAHVVLGERLARAGRSTEARAEFEVAREQFEALREDPLWYVRDTGMRIALSTEDALLVATYAAAGRLTELGAQPDEPVGYANPALDPDSLRLPLLTTRMYLADLLEDDGLAITELTELAELSQELVDTDPDRFLQLHSAVLNRLARRSRHFESGEQFLQRARSAADTMGSLSSMSGGAFVTEKAAALLIRAAAVEVGNVPIRELLDSLREIVDLYRTARVPETQLAGSPLLTAVTQNLLEWARFTEQAQDGVEAARLAKDVVEAGRLLHTLDPTACFTLLEALLTRARLEERAGHTEESVACLAEARIHLPHLTDEEQRFVMAGAICNNLGWRYRSLGRTAEALEVAEAGLDALGPAVASRVGSDVKSWQLAASLIVLVNTVGPANVVRRRGDLVIAVLAAAPVPTQGADIERNLPRLGLSVAIDRIIQGDANGRDAALRALGQAMTRPGLSRDVVHSCAQLGYDALCRVVDAGQVDDAAAIYRLLVALTGDRTDVGTFLEQAKAATELVQAYLTVNRRVEAAKVIRDAMPILRSPEYLAARVRDLGQSPEDFLASLDNFLASVPPY